MTFDTPDDLPHARVVEDADLVVERIRVTTSSHHTSEYALLADDGPPTAGWR